MGIDSETLELLTLWRQLSGQAKARMLEKARFVAISAGLDKTPEFAALFESVADSDRDR